MGLPDKVAREAIIKYCLRDAPTVDAFPFDQMAEKTEAYSGADIAEICRSAKKSAIWRQIESGKEEFVTIEDFEKGVSTISPSVKPAAVAEYEKWKNSHTAARGDDDDE